jgi:hypothetical protein
MWYCPEKVPRLFNSLCFGVFLAGLFVLIDSTAEAFADGLAGTQPAFLMSLVLCFAPLYDVVALLVYPVLGGIAHWRWLRASEPTAWLALIHAILALLGGMALMGATVITQRLVHLNGGRTVSAGQIVGNLLVLGLLMLAIRGGKASVRSETAPI